MYMYMYIIMVLSRIAGLKVDEFMAFYREFFPKGSVTPKMHILEDHMKLWMEKWQVTPGLHSEQGLESIHSQFNHLE